MNTKKLLLIAVLAVAMSVVPNPISPPQPLQAQIAVTTTALSGSLNLTGRTFTVVSATGFQASTATQSFYAYIDREAMLITAVNGTSITVFRGQLNTASNSHRSGAIVVTGLAERFISQDPYPGACTRASGQSFTPLINTTTGTWWDCSTVKTAAAMSGPGGNPGNPTDGTWQGVNLMGYAPVVPYKNPGNQAYTALLTDWFIDFNSMTAPRTLTLPALTDLRGKIYVIKNSAIGQPLTVVPSAGQFILTIGTTTVNVTSNDTVLRLISVGGGWTTW